MPIGSYVQNKQRFVYQTFSNALTSKRLAHSYLLLGNPGTPLKETAIYLAKSILCDHPAPLADETCVTCKRIDNGDYPDYVIFDGEGASIKKEDVAHLVSSFQQTALERKGIMVYVIHLVENMTTEAVNALLKFLEEPPDHAYAILTTENESRVLPTIISRCQSIRTLLYPRENVVKEALEIGVSNLDAELLSHFYNDAELVKDKAEEESYQQMRALLLKSIEALEQEEGECRYRFEKDIIPSLNAKPILRLYIDCMAIVFEDILRLRSGSTIHLASMKEGVAHLESRYENAQLDLLDLLTMRNEVDLNINPSLLITHFLFLLFHRKKKTN